MRYANIVIAPKFAESVDEVIAYAAQRNQARADALDDEIDRCVASLDQNARRGRKLPELNDDTVRELLIAKQELRLIYRLDDARSVVEVLILWSARRPLQLAGLLDGE